MKKVARPYVKILAVDDDRDILRVIERGLQLAPFEHVVVTAETGREGLARAKKEKPDLIILDLLLPDMDGFAVARALKKDPATASIRIIMLTALDTNTNRWESIDLDIDDFVGKPFDLFELESRVRYQLLERLKEKEKAR